MSSKSMYCTHKNLSIFIHFARAGADHTNMQALTANLFTQIANSNHQTETRLRGGELTFPHCE